LQDDNDHLDGNALGGLLRDVFGREMTDQRGCCDMCGVVNPLGAAMVYRDAPGDVVRCSNCQSVVLVAVPGPTGIRISFGSLRWIEIPSE
jgi:hypothetical protein